MPDLDPADLLKVAAAKLRRLAEDAIEATTCGCHPGQRETTWTYDGDDSVDLASRSHDVVTGASYGGTHLDPGLGRHIAAMGPGVALALADLLDAEADNAAYDAWNDPKATIDGPALILARLIDNDASTRDH